MAKTVCIIGAGPSGLVAAKSFLHNAGHEDFRVTVFDAQSDIGGLWPTAKHDSRRQIHPLMVANQSKHTVQFSDLAWDKTAPQLPKAWMVGQYLQRYLDTYLANHPRFSLCLGSRVTAATRPDARPEAWEVTFETKDGPEKRIYDHIVVASGFFGRPIIPVPLSRTSDIPVIHSSQYRDLKDLLGPGKPGGGRILVVGGQMSGVEIAGTMATHLSQEIHAPETSDIADIENYTIHHVVQRPIWVFPLFTTPIASAVAAPFLPLDFASYNRSNRPSPLANTQGHITEEQATTTHGTFEFVLGTDQSIFSPHLHVSEEHRTTQPYLAVSDWYCDFVRSGLITLSKGKVESIENGIATLTGSQKVDHIAAVVVATGFDPTPCLDFLAKDILSALNHSPKHVEQPLALAFHGTHHPAVPGLGFVGLYRSPYWGVMQMQARFLAKLWSHPTIPKSLRGELDADHSVDWTLSLRDNPRLSQFPMGDYSFLMQEISRALGTDILSLPVTNIPKLPHNEKPLDMLTPSRYPASEDKEVAKQHAQTSLEDTREVTISGLTTPRFVARAVFRSLLGKWKLERDLGSKLPSHPSGHFSGTAEFCLRKQTPDGLLKANGEDNSTLGDEGLEFLYIEDGEFKTEQGFGFRATRRYIWRYDETKDKLSVWFVKTDDMTRADYLFHEIDFLQPKEGREGGWMAKAGHLCVEDFYDVNYNFRFKAVNLDQWSIGYTVKGPKKDYTIAGTYTR